MSVAADNAAVRSGIDGTEEQFMDDEVQMSNIDEFISIWFALGHLKSDIPFPPIPARDASPNEVSSLARILHTWLTHESKPDILSAITYGRSLGKQLCHVCLSKGIIDQSLYNLVRDIADFYAAYVQDLEDEAGKSLSKRKEESRARNGGHGSRGGDVNEKEKRKGMGEFLEMVLANDRGSSKLPGWGRMIWEGKLLFALLHGATEAIKGALGDAARKGI
ncbi:hypothetical protein ONS96_000975 [Cadophora gregata f. sp. sojae]|nr:hypothetical protein ONS96_000975 [Cadophora gregata f. sp. sojae]